MPCVCARAFMFVYVAALLALSGGAILSRCFLLLTKTRHKEIERAMGALILLSMFGLKAGMERGSSTRPHAAWSLSSHVSHGPWVIMGWRLEVSSDQISPPDSRS